MECRAVVKIAASPKECQLIGENEIQLVTGRKWRELHDLNVQGCVYFLRARVVGDERGWARVREVDLC